MFYWLRDLWEGRAVREKDAELRLALEERDRKMAKAGRTAEATKARLRRVNLLLLAAEEAEGLFRREGEEGEAEGAGEPDGDD